MRDLAARLEAAARWPISEALFRAYGYDAAGKRVRPDAALAITPMAILRKMAGDAMREAGCPPSRVDPALDVAWHVPNPVTTAQPLTDLHVLFDTLRARGAKIAIATGDDRAPTEAALAACGVAGLVDALACADDGVPVKPAPDTVLGLCRSLGVPAARTAVVGDTVADMQMGRAAGAGISSSGCSLASARPTSWRPTRMSCWNRSQN